MTEGLMANSVTTTTATLSWRSHPDHLSYSLRWRRVGTATWTIGSPTTDTTQTILQLEAGTV